MGKTVGTVDEVKPAVRPLGVMSSMSSECTPLKHRYDACFNRWFEDYLGLGVKATESTSESARPSFWSSATKSSENSSVSDALSLGGIQRSASERKSLRDRLEGDCGQFWGEYRSCVLKAVKEKDLEGLIDEARAHNPFPFRQDGPTDKPNNEPFPFPSASDR